jgi:hypothetical protein
MKLPEQAIANLTKHAAEEANRAVQRVVELIDNDPRVRVVLAVTAIELLHQASRAAFEQLAGPEAAAELYAKLARAA